MSLQITLPENLTIHNINEQFSAIKQNLESIDDDVIIDAVSVDSIDTSGLQMLLVVIQFLTSNNIMFSWQNVPEIMQESAIHLGLANQLQLS